MAYQTMVPLEKLLDRARRQEVFVYEFEGTEYRYDVTGAWRIIIENPRDTVLFRPAEQGVDIHHVLDRFQVDIDYAARADTSVPLLFVPFRGQAQLIDGAHRLARALMDEEPLGSAVLECLVLTEEEASRILLSVKTAEERFVPA